MYVVIDRQTGLQVGEPYQNKNRASSRADKLDIEYGAVRYFVKTLVSN